MKNLTTAIYSKFSGSDFSSDIGGRFFKGMAPATVEYPYAVFFVVSDVPGRTFSEYYEDVILQFSLFSIASETTEVEDMYTDLISLYDECELTIEEETLIWMREGTSVFQAEDHTTPTGTRNVWVYHVDFDIKIQLNPYAVIWQGTPAVEFEDTTGVAYEDRS